MRFRFRSLAVRRFFRGLAWLCPVCGGAVAVVACGGAVDTFLLDAPGFASSTPDASSSGSPDSSLPSVGPGASDAGPPKDASPIPVPDAAPPPPPPPVHDAGIDSAPPPPVDPGVSCGKDFCNPASQVCCVTSNGGGNNQNFSCEIPNDCANGGGLALPCAKSADCVLAGSPAGTVCCVTEGIGNQGSPSVACVPAPQCADPTTQAWMCDPSAPQCPPGDTCKISMVTVPPYSICVAP
jgi:hypothetical protein